MEKLKVSTKCDYPIKIYKGKCYTENYEYCRFLISSEPMFDDLEKAGVIQRKSLVLTYPSTEVLPSSLNWHFIRGYFDGDGSFSKETKGHMFKVCGIWDFITVFADRVGKPDLKLQQRRKDKNNWQLSVGGRRQVQRIANLMYQDATVYLDRKYEIYNSYIKPWTSSYCPMP